MRYQRCIKAFASVALQSVAAAALTPILWPLPPAHHRSYLPAGRWGGTGADEGKALAVDSAGYTWTIGKFASSMPVGSTNLTSAGNSDVFVARFDSSGVAQWAVRLGGSTADEGLALALSPAGDAVAIAGKFTGTAAFGAVSLTSAGGNDAFVAKLDSSGAVLWAVGIGSTSADEATAVAFNAAGDVFVTGSFA